MYQPSPQPPPKKKRIGLWITLGVVGLFVVSCTAIFATGFHDVNTAPTPTVTMQAVVSGPTHAPRPTTAPITWKTAQLFEHVTQTQPKAEQIVTESFTVPAHWRIEWFCDTKSYGDVNYNVIADVYKSDGTKAETTHSLNILCGANGMHGYLEENVAGTFRLQILSEWRWIVGIQVPK